MTSVSRETSERLAIYADNLRRWTAKINLVAPSTLADLEHRHIDDSAQLLDHAGVWSNWCDIGSGAGLPGIVVAIHHPIRRVNLIESDHRKSVFLTHVVRTLHLNVMVLPTRIEVAPPQSADVVSARALAPLLKLIPLMLRHGHSETRYLIPKGARYRSELDEIRAVYTFDVDVRPSITDKEAVILVMENIAHV